LPRSEGIGQASGLCGGRGTGEKGRRFFLSVGEAMTGPMVRGRSGRANESVDAVAMQAEVRRTSGGTENGLAEG